MSAGLFGQAANQVRHDWGPVGAVATQADAVAVVDVLSFSTAVNVAVERGTTVFPYQWRDDGAADFASAKSAVLAVGRSETTSAAGETQPSLSPAGLLRGVPVPRLVLPSPNGSTIVVGMAAEGARVAAGCLRNARAVAHWLLATLNNNGSVAVISAGERWRTDDSLRPALEDHLGAGAIFSAMVRAGGNLDLSPEAELAKNVFESFADRLEATLYRCVGGRELQRIGFAQDIEVAAALDVSSVVPVLDQGAFVAGT